MPYIPGRRGRKEKEEDLKKEEEVKALERRPGDIDLLKLKKAYEELEETHRQIRESHIELILKLAIAAEYKDPDTGSHILRISDYSTEVAKAIGLSADEIEILRYASPMHDIGKIGIPDSILQKPGKLTPEEWEIMKQHSLIGARMLKSAKSPLLSAAGVIAETHHEKFDGSGYPYGIKGDSIPLFGRIVALVDVFDAIVSKRCYKEKWPFEEAINYIQTLGGTHLDPELVAVFGKLKKEIKGIYTANVAIEDFIADSSNEKLAN